MADKLLYDKTLGLEVDPMSTQKYYNPNISEVEDISDYSKVTVKPIGPERAWQNPTRAQFVGQYFEGAKQKYLNRETISPEDLEDINEVQYRNQTTMEALGNGFTSRALSIIPKVLDIPGSVVGFGASLVDYAKDSMDPDVESNFAKSLKLTTDNFWVNAMSDADEGLKSLFPVFGSKYGYYSNSLSDNLTSAKFWAEDGFDGLAFTASALVPGIGWAKALSSISKSAKVAGFFEKAAKFSKFGKEAKLLEKATAEELKSMGINSLTTLLTAGTNVINESALEAHDFGKTLDESQFIAAKLQDNDKFKKIIELESKLESMPDDPERSAIDPVGPKEDMYNLIESQKSELIKELHNEFVNQKAQGQLDVFKWNTIFLSAPDYFQAKMFGKAFGNIDKSIRQSVRSGGVDKIVAKNIMVEGLRQGGLGVLREGAWEENVQSAVQDYYKDKITLTPKATKNIYNFEHPSFVDGIVNNMFDNISAENKEGFKAVLLGAVSGGLSSVISGAVGQSRENKQISEEEAKWNFIKKMGLVSTNTFVDDYKKILGSDGKITNDNLIKSSTYAMSKKASIDSQVVADMLGLDIMHELGQNDEISRKFFEEISSVNGSKYTNEQEAIDLLKENLLSQKEREDKDEATDALVDSFIGKIDRLQENFNKAKDVINAIAKGMDEESVSNINTLTKTLFFGLNKLSELEDIYKRKSGEFSESQKESFNVLQEEYKNAVESLQDKNQVAQFMNKFNEEANRHKSLQSEIKNLESKPKEERDENKIKALKYELEELYEINGWEDSKSRDTTYEWGMGHMKMSLSPTEVIKRENLGTRDRFFYDLGRDAYAKNELKGLLESEETTFGEIDSFVSTDKLLYLSKKDVDSILSKAKSIYDNISGEFNRRLKEIKKEYSEDQGEMHAKIIDLRNEIEILSESAMDDLSNKINESYKKKELDRNEFLGSEENATTDSFITNIRRRIALDFKLRMSNYLNKISEDIDSYSNTTELSNTIRDVEDRIIVFENSDNHINLINGYVDSLKEILSALKNLQEVVEKNKGNKLALDQKLRRIELDVLPSVFGFVVRNESISVVNKELYNSIKSKINSKLWSKFEKNIVTAGKESETIFFDKLFNDMSGDERSAVIEVIRANSKSISSNMNIPSGQSQLTNGIISYIKDNPQKSALSLFAHLSTPEGLLKFNGKQVFLSSKKNKKNISDKYVLHGNLDLLLDDITTIEPNGNPALMNENQSLSRESFENVVSIIKDLISLRNNSLAIEQLQSNIDLKKLVNEEEALGRTVSIAPSLQQRSVISTITKWMFNNQYDGKNAFSNARIINGLAGTGKTTVVAKYIFSLMSKLSGLDVDKNVISLGSTIHVANGLSESISKKIDKTSASVQSFVDSKEDISQDIDVIIIDEIGAVKLETLAKLEEKVRKANNSRVASGKMPIKMLLFGDPNQIQDSPFRSLPDTQRVFLSVDAGTMVTAPLISTQTLIVQYRSDIDAINDVADSFAGRKYDVSGLTAKANTRIDDEKSEKLGVHATQSKAAFISSLQKEISRVIKNGAGEKIVFAYNTELERAEILNSLKENERIHIEAVKFGDVQGRTLNSLFVYLTMGTPGVQDSSMFNAAMYMLSSRPKNYLCIYDVNKIFDSNVEDAASIGISSERNKEQIVKNVQTYRTTLKEEKDIMNEQSVSKKKDQKPKDDIKEEKPKDQKPEEPLEEGEEILEDSRRNTVLGDEPSDTDHSEDSDKLEDELNKRADDYERDLDKIDESEETVSIKNPTSSNYDSVELKQGDEVMILGVGDYSNNTRRYIVVKRVDDELTEVGTLTSEELKSLGLSESNFNEDLLVAESSNKKYQYSKVKGVLARDNGNEISFKVAKASKFKMRYGKEFLEGAGLFNKIVASLASVLKGKSFSKTIFLPKKTNMKAGSEYAHLPLRLGVPYLLVSVDGSNPYFVQLEPKRFNRENSWMVAKQNNKGIETGVQENAFNVVESFYKGVKGVRTWLNKNNIDIKFGDIEFRNLIYAIALSSKISRFDRITDVISLRSNLKFEKFEDISENKTQAKLVADIFGNDIELFNKFLKSQKVNLEGVIKNSFTVKSSYSNFSVKESIEDGDKYKLLDSYESFLNILRGGVTTMISSDDEVSKETIVEILKSLDVKDQISDEDIKILYNSVKSIRENKSSIGDMIEFSETIIDAFENNKLFPKSSSKNIFVDSNGKPKNVEDVRNYRRILKTILKYSPIEGKVNNLTYTWMPEEKEEKDSKKHILMQSDGNSATPVSSSKISSSYSKIQHILDNLARANQTINGKNFRKKLTGKAAELTGYERIATNVFWENSERNNESLPEDSRNFHFDGHAEAYSESKEKELMASDETNVSERIESMREITESYTWREEDLKYILDGNTRRQISRSEVFRAIKDMDDSILEDAVGTFFSHAEESSLVLYSGKKKAKPEETKEAPKKKTTKASKQQKTEEVEVSAATKGIVVEEQTDKEILDDFGYNFFDEDDMAYEKSAQDSEEQLGDLISIDEANKYLRKVFPGIQLDFLKILETVRFRGKEAYGRFVNGVIEIESESNNTVRQNVLRHESFHKIWNEFLNENIKSEMTQLFLSSLNDEQKEFYRSLDKKSLDEYVEESIARKYQVYNKNQNVGIFEGVLSKLKAIISELFRLISGRSSELNHYFNLIDFGFFNKKINSFSGSRNYYGIIKDYNKTDAYVEAKYQVSIIYDKLVNGYNPETNMPYAQQEINGAIIKKLELLKQAMVQAMSGLKVNSVNYNKAKKILDSVDVLLSTKKRKDGSISYDKLSKMLDEVLPGRRDNNIVVSYVDGKAITDDKFGKEIVDDTEEHDEQEEIETVEATPGVEAAFEINSDKHDRETKVFAAVKHFLSTIKKNNGSTYLDPRQTFKIAFKLMEAVDNDSQNPIKDIFDRMNNELLKRKSNPYTEEQMMKSTKSEISVFLALRDLFNKADYNQYNYPVDIIKKYELDEALKMRKDIAVVLDSRGDIDYIIIDKNKNDIIGKTKSAVSKDAIIVYAKDIKLTQSNLNTLIVEKAISLAKESGIEVRPYEIAGIARKEIARNKWVEVFNTFTSLRESDLTLIKVKSTLKGVYYKIVSGQSSESNFVESNKIEFNLRTKFKTVDSLAKFVNDNKDKFTHKELDDKKISSTRDLEQKSKLRTTKINAIIEFAYLADLLFKKSDASDKDSAKTMIAKSLKLDNVSDEFIDDISSKIAYFFSKNVKDAIIEINKNKKDSSPIEDMINDLQSDDIDSVFLELMNKAGDLISSYSSLITTDTTRSRVGTFKDAKGRKRYTITMTEFADRVMKKIVLYGSLKGGIFNKDYFKTDFMQNNFIIKFGNFQKIYKFTLHSGTKYSNRMFGDRVIEYDSEGFSQYVHRNIFANFLDSFAKKLPDGNVKYDQPVYIKSNRPDTQAARMNVLRTKDIFDVVIPSVFDQFTSQDLEVLGKWRLSDKSDKTIDPAAFVNMQIMKEALMLALDINEDGLRELVKNKKKWTDLDSNQISKIKSIINDKFDSQAKQLSEEIVSANIKLPEQFVSMLKNLLIYDGKTKEESDSIVKELLDNKFEPAQYSGEKWKDSGKGVYSNKPEMLYDAMKLYLLNDYFNAFALNQLFSGNMNAFEKGDSMLKRMSVIFGPGMNGTVGRNGIREKSNVLVIKDPKYKGRDKWLSDLENYGVEKSVIDSLKNKNSGSVNYSDGQGYITPRRYEELKRAIGATYNLATVGKPLWYDVDEDGISHAVKYSWIVLTDDLVNNDKSGGLRNLRDLMERNDIDEAVFESAVKVGLPMSAISYEDALNGNEIAKESIDASIMKLNNKNYRLQLNPYHEFGEDQVAIPTQLLFILNILGTNNQRANLAYDALSSLMNIGLSELKSRFGNSKGYNIPKLKAEIDENLRRSKSSEAEASMRDSGITYDFPTLSNKAVNMISSLFKNETVKHRLKGGKAIMEASYGHKNRKGQDLQFNVIGKGKEAIIVAEALISKSAARKILSDEQFKYLEEFFSNKENEGKNPDLILANGDILGFRIPSSEIHSGIALNIVGWLDDESVSIVVAKEVVQIHGSDFDVDSLFVVGRSIIYDKDKNILNYTKDNNGQLRYKVLSSEEIFKLSKKDKKIYYKNLISELILEAVADISNVERTQAPISIDDLKDEIEAIKKETGVSVDKKQMDLSNFFDRFKAHQSSHNGSAGTGIFANSFKGLSYLITSGENNKAPIIRVGEKEFKLTDDLKVWSIIDALINAAVDNVKEQILPFFNLNPNTMSTFVAITATSGFDIASRMSLQPFFKRIAEVRDNRNAGYVDTASKIKELVSIVGENNVPVEYDIVTKEELNEAISKLNKLGINSLFDLMDRLKKDPTNEELINLAKGQIKFFNAYNDYKKIGDDLTTISTALSVVWSFPAKIEDIDAKIEQIKSIFDINVITTIESKGEVKDKVENVNDMSRTQLNKYLKSLNVPYRVEYNIKDTFTVKAQNLLKNVPQFKVGIDILFEIRSAISAVVFKHSDIVEESLDLMQVRRTEDLSESGEKEDEDVVSELDDLSGKEKEEFEEESASEATISSAIKNDIKSRNQMKDALIKFLMNTLNWDKTFVGYDNVGDAKIKINKVETVVSGQDAFKKIFAEKVFALKKYLRDNGIQNMFLDNIVGVKKWNDVEEWNMPNSIDFKPEDILMLKQSFIELSRYQIARNENGEFVVEKTNSFDFKEWQYDFVRYGTMSQGMSFGATNFSMALPELLYKDLSDQLEELINNLWSNGNLIKRNIYRFYNQYVMNNVNKLKQYDGELVKSNGLFYGSVTLDSKKHYYDIKLAVKEGAIPSIIQRQGTKAAYAYKLIGSDGKYAYFYKLGTERPTETYNTTIEEFMQVEDMSYGKWSEKILDYDSTITEDVWNQYEEDFVTGKVKEDKRARILFDASADTSIPNILTINNKLKEISIPKDMWKFLKSEFKENTFPVILRNYSDITYSKTIKAYVTLAGTEDSPKIKVLDNIDRDSEAIWLLAKEKFGDQISKELWDSMTDEEKQNSINC